MANKIQLRRDTTANWTSTNPTLSQGELGLELSTGKIKIGTGNTAWNSLNYLTAATNLVTGSLTFPDATVQSTAWLGTVAYANVTGTPTLAAVATSGQYNSLSGIPSLAAVATSGSYLDLTNTPAAYVFSVAADDSTQRQINANELVKFVGAGGITTASDAEGVITITHNGSVLWGNIINLNGANGPYSIALGLNANAGTASISLGQSAGATNQGANAIAIGQNAGAANQSANSIVLNASGTVLNGAAAGFYVRPVREVTGPQTLYFDPASYEITWGPVPAGGAGGAGTGDYIFRVAADDSTQRVINNGETLQLRGTNGVSTVTDGEGAVTISVNISAGGGYVNNAVTRYDGTTGTVIQNSLVTIADDGAITAPNNTGSMIPFYYADAASFPAASTSHGALAHNHATGKMYYAHGGVWLELANFSDITPATDIFRFSVAADDSTQRLISSNELVKFVGAGGITTASDAEGTITITGTGGTVTSVAALTVGTTGVDITSTVATSTTTPVITLQIPTASAVNRGALSAADWSTFNNKGTGTVTSVAATVPAFLSVAGSPVTSSGTLAITLSGSALPVINGGTGTTTPSLVQGSNVTITGTWPNQTINSTASGGSTTFAALTDNASLTADRFYLPAITQLVVTTPVFNYNIDQYSGDNPTIYAISGTTISFNLQVSGSHPFLLQTNTGGGFANITTTNLIHVSTSGVVSTGSSAQGKTSGTLYYKIPGSVSGTFRYVCSNHGSMVGTITVKDIAAI